MATYKELHKLIRDGGLSNRVHVALLDVANDIRTEATGTPNHANRYVWASQVIRDPEPHEMPMLRGVLMVNAAASVGTILNAPDSAIKANVAALVNLFAEAE